MGAAEGMADGVHCKRHRWKWLTSLYESCLKFNAKASSCCRRRQGRRLMLALPGGMCEERDVAALRDRHVRLKSNRTDMELDLPPNIPLPDGEEVPYGSAKGLQIRDSEQESEIIQKCLRPPPNVTVFDRESPPPYRSSSAGLLSHNTPGSIDWAQDTPPEKVIRCHSMSSGSSRSGSTPSTTPAVVVPSRSRRLSAFSDTGATGGALSQLTMVPCHRGAEPPV